MTEHISISEYRRRTAAQKPSKYHSIKTMVDGIVFDSKAEAWRYDELKLLLHCGEIRSFGCQPSFVIGTGIRYRPDFIVCDKDGRIWVEDVKGVETAAFKIKKKMFKEKYPYLELKIIRA